MSTRPAGGVRLGRLVAFCAPGTIACLVVTAGIFLGWFPVAIAGAQPIEVAVSHGSADSLALGMATDRSVTELSSTTRERGGAIIDISDGRLDDLCLLPRVYLPLLGRTASLRISTPDAVRLARVTLAAPGLKAQRLSTPQVAIGHTPTASLIDKGYAGGKGGFSVISQGNNAITMNGLAVPAYGMVLPDGMRLSSLALSPSFDDQTC